MWHRKLLTSCQSCLEGRNFWIHTSTTCTLKCDFCSFYGEQPDPLGDDEYLLHGQVRKTKELIEYLGDIKDHYDGVGYTWMEPMEHMDKLIAPMMFLQGLDKWQWMNTNGVRCNAETLGMLRWAGLTEIRFNCQAMDFNPIMFRKMRLAKKYIKYVGIETPLFSRSFNNLIKHRQRINVMQIPMINLPELHINEHQFDLFKDEGEIRYHEGTGYWSPVGYEDMKAELQKLKWYSYINWCSNDQKKYRNDISNIKIMEM